MQNKLFGGCLKVHWIIKSVVGFPRLGEPKFVHQIEQIFFLHVWFFLSFQMFIFTDGEVGNTRDVLHCVKSNVDFHRHVQIKT